MSGVLLTGSGGFVGAHLHRHLAQCNARVVSGVRTPAQDALHLRWTGVDHATLVHSLRASEIDVIVHLAGLAHGDSREASAPQLLQVNAQQSYRLYQAAAAAGVRRFVWLSSIKVLGERSSAPLSADAPLRPEDAYARSKAEGERLLLAAADAAGAPQLAILRPPLVYGPGVGANFLRLLRLAQSRLPLPLGGADAPRSMVGIDNLVSVLEVLTHRGSGIFHVSDGEDWSVAHWLHQLGSAMQRAPRLFFVPPAVLRGLARMVGRGSVAARLLDPLQVDSTTSNALLNWQPVSDVQAQLEATVRWFLQRP